MKRPRGNHAKRWAAIGMATVWMKRDTSYLQLNKNRRVGTVPMGGRGWAPSEPPGQRWRWSAGVWVLKGVEAIMRGQVFNQSLVILQDSWFREIHKRE